MGQLLSAKLLWLAMATTVVAQQLARAPESHRGVPLVQVEHLVGDQYSGFAQSCLLVYSDGRYRREFRRQQSRSGHAAGTWRQPMVFEGTLDTEDMQRLSDIIESEKFRGVVGTIGEGMNVLSRLVMTPDGVYPHTDIEILEALVAHKGTSQAFEVIGAHRQTAEVLSRFKKWISSVEKNKAQQLDAGAADLCTASPAAPGGSSWQPETSLTATSSYAPLPDYSAEELSTKQPGSVTIHVSINSDGSVASASVLHGLSPILDRRALDAVKKWKFAPARIYGIPIPTEADVAVQFHAN